MKKAGILCAADTELHPFLKRMEVERTVEKAMLKFYEGTLLQIPAVAVYSGVGRVNAAVAAELLIERFGVDGIINAGTAGGADPKVRLFDTVIAERSVYHDVAEDILTEFHPWMPSVYFPSDKELLSAARRYAETAGRPILFGTIATGERFVEPPGTHLQSPRPLGGGYGDCRRRPCLLCQPDALSGGEEYYRCRRWQRSGGL